jgi:predicted ribosome quality control (RQC) complex YloA/Tae2 family protein
MISIDLYKYWNKEIAPVIINAYINNIALSSKGYEIELFTREGKRVLYLDVPYYPFFFNKLEKEKEDEITRLLRDEIGKKITNSKIFGLNRTTLIEIEDGLKIYAEFYSPGIVIITDERNTIIAASAYKNFGRRKIEKGAVYEAKEIAVIRDPNEFISEVRKSNKENVVKALAMDLRLGSIYAEELLRRAQIDKEIKIQDLNDEMLVKLFNIYLQLLEEYIPTICNEEITTIKCDGKQFEQVNDAIVVKEFTIKTQKESLEKEIIKERIAAIESNIDKIYEAQRIVLNKALSFEERKKQIEALGLKLEGDKLILNDIRIGIKQNPYEVINTLYERLKREKNKVLQRSTMLKEAKIYFENKWFARFLYTYTSTNKLLVWGKDEAQNNLLINKYLTPNDYVFHADLMGAPFVILKGEPADKDIEEAAIIAGSYSVAWKEMLGNVSVFYVKGEQVTRSPPSGEYLKKGAFYIEGKRNYITTITQIYLTIEEASEGLLKILPSAHEARSYILIQPGRKRETEEIIKIIAKKLKYKVNKDTIDHLIPSGGFSIKKVRL